MSTCRSVIVLCVLGVFSQSVSAATFDLSASYADGTMLNLIYDDNDGDPTDSLCLFSCDIRSGSVTLGSDLQAIVDTNSNAFNINIANLLDNDHLALFVTPQFSPFHLEVDATDPETGIAIDTLRGGIILNGDPVFSLSDVFCIGSGTNGVGCTSINEHRAFVHALSVNITEKPNAPVPIPAALPLVTLGLASIGWCRRRRAQ